MGSLMLRIAAVLLTLVTINSAHAQQFTTNSFATRIFAGSSGYVLELENAANDAKTNGSQLEAGLSFQFNDTLFGTINYSSNSIDSTEINDVTTERDETWTSTVLGVGLRSTYGTGVGNYYGIAYYHDLDAAESGDSSALISLFMEKDNSRRFGRLGLSRAAENATGNIIGGTHVWFLESGLGLGFDWSYEAGEDALDLGIMVEYTEISGGLLLMYRL